jgi:hypothetical protein
MAPSFAKPDSLYLCSPLSISCSSHRMNYVFPNKFIPSDLQLGDPKELTPPPLLAEVTGDSASSSHTSTGAYSFRCTDERSRDGIHRLRPGRVLLSLQVRRHLHPGRTPVADTGTSSPPTGGRRPAPRHDVPERGRGLRHLPALTATTSRSTTQMPNPAVTGTLLPSRLRLGIYSPFSQHLSL